MDHPEKQRETEASVHLRGKEIAVNSVAAARLRVDGVFVGPPGG
jgi:hypothetical protein